MLSIFFALLQVLHRGPKSQVTVNNKKNTNLYSSKTTFHMVGIIQKRIAVVRHVQTVAK